MKERTHRDGSCALCFRVWPMNLPTAQLHTKKLFHPFVLRNRGNCRLNVDPKKHVREDSVEIEERLGIESPDFFPSRLYRVKRTRALSHSYPGQDLDQSRDRNFLGEY